MGATVLTAEQDALRNELRQKFDLASKARQQLERKWTHFHALYHNYQDFRAAHSEARTPRDVYDSLGRATSDFGFANLFIPYSFATVETILPRLLSNSPRMLVVPGVKSADENVETMRQLLNAQQDQISYELRLQDTAKSGLIYGLGVQKDMWRKEVRQQKMIRRSIDPEISGSTYVEDTTARVFDDPDAIDVDIFDFFWDPFGYDMETIGWCIHRTWRSTSYVMGKVRDGSWQLPGMTAEDVKNMASPQKYDEAWADRLRALRDEPPSSAPRGDIHEVWEFHDGQRVCVLLDREHPVLERQNPAWHGDLPFSIYRPTGVLHQFCGKGEIEPMEDLQEEINTLRSQRRDNATYVLQQPFAFSDGFIEEGDLKFGPGVGIPVQGDPREAIFPIKVGDIPNSGYAEEDRLKADIERVTGISDALAGGGGTGSDGSASATATGVQITAAATGERVKLKLRRLEVELIRRVAQHWIELNQQHIIANRDVRVPYTPMPGEPDRRWAWIQVSPDNLAGAMEARPDAGATAPENAPQNRQDGLQLWQMFGQDPNMDRAKLLVKVLKLFGLQQPEGYLAPPPTTVPVAALNLIEQGLTQDLMGIGKYMVDKGLAPPPNLIHPEQTVRDIIDQAVQQANQQGPAPQQPSPDGGPPPAGMNGNEPVPVGAGPE